jgi:hypothetical protein
MKRILAVLVAALLLNSTARAEWPAIATGWHEVQTSGGGGGVTNSAGNNVVPKSDGTNLVASTVTDDGTLVTINTRTKARATVLTDGTGAFLDVTGTLPASPTQPVAGIKATITGAGSAAQTQTGVDITVLSGYTGSSRSTGLKVANDTPNANDTGPVIAILGSSSAPAQGDRYGVTGIAENQGAAYSFVAGVYGGAYNNSGGNASAAGVRGVATGLSQSAGGFFSLSESGSAHVPTAITSVFPETAALLADNGAVAAPIFLGRDNGTTKFSILDGGAVQLGTPGSGTNGAATSGTIQAAPGTGTGAVSRLLLGGPVLGSTGSTVQTIATPVSIGGEVKADGTAGFLDVTGTLPASPSAGTAAVKISPTFAAQTAQHQDGLRVETPNTGVAAGGTAAIYGKNANYATNGGYQAVGVYGFSEGGGGDQNARVGVKGVAGAYTSGYYGVGVLGNVTNIAAGSYYAAGLFSLGAVNADNALAFATQAALLADNGSVAAPIFLARDNGTTKFSILDGGAVDINSPSIATDGTIPALKVTATLPASTSQSVNGVLLDITGAGTASQEQRAFRAVLNSGYTGSSATFASRFLNSSAGIGTAINYANIGVEGSVDSTTTGTNIGYSSYAVNRGSGKAVGLAAIAAHSLGTGNKVGTYTLLSAADDTSKGAALFARLGANGEFDVPAISTTTVAILDNGGLTTAPILTMQKGGATVSGFGASGNLYGNLSKTLTESSATGFVEIAVASGNVVSAEIDYEIEANDATDYQVLSGTIRVNGVNKGGTVTASIGEVGSQVSTLSTGTLTTTNTVTAGTGKFTVNANAVSSLTQTTLRIKYFVRSAKPITATGL